MGETNRKPQTMTSHHISQPGFLFSLLPHLLFALPSFSTLISQAELLISTNLCNHLHFITAIFHHPRQASLLPKTIASPIHPLARLPSRQPRASHCLISITVSIIIPNFIRLYVTKWKFHLLDITNTLTSQGKRQTDSVYDFTVSSADLNSVRPSVMERRLYESCVKSLFQFLARKQSRDKLMEVVWFFETLYVSTSPNGVRGRNIFVIFIALITSNLVF
jgi:hypothetical protein